MINCSHRQLSGNASIIPCHAVFFVRVVPSGVRACTTTPNWSPRAASLFREHYVARPDSLPTYLVNQIYIHSVLTCSYASTGSKQGVERDEVDTSVSSTGAGVGYLVGAGVGARVREGVGAGVGAGSGTEGSEMGSAEAAPHTSPVSVEMRSTQTK